VKREVLTSLDRNNLYHKTTCRSQGRSRWYWPITGMHIAPARPTGQAFFYFS